MARYKKGSRAREEDVYDNSKLQRAWINPQLARAKYPPDNVLRSEYSRLRDIAQKRWKRLKGKPEAEETYMQHPSGFPTLKEIGRSRTELVRALGDLDRFLMSHRGSVSKIHESNKKTIKALRKKGINVTDSDLREYGKFMNRIKKIYGIGDDSLGSDLVADLWSEIKDEGGITADELKRRLDQIKLEATKIERNRIGKTGHRQSYGVKQAKQALSDAKETKKRSRRKR